MDNLPAEILIRIFDKSRLSDQLISHRLINNKFRSFIPTSSSRFQRVNTTDLIAISKKLALFSQENCAYYHSRKYLHEDPKVERAYANLLLYVCNLCGASLKCISFTTPLFLDSATMEKLVIMCPNIIEINVGYENSRVRYFGGDVQSIFYYVCLALPRFPQLRILRIISHRDTDTSLLEPIVAQLRLQKLRTAGSMAPVLTADPNLLEELVVQTWSKSGEYRDIVHNRLFEIFPNLRRHYMKNKHVIGADISADTAEANYRNLHMLRGSSCIGGRNLWFIDERLFRDFPYLQNINVTILDDESCAIFINALQSSRNWKALDIKLYYNSRVSNEKRMQLLQALFSTTAVRLKSLTLMLDLVLDHAFREQFLKFDQGMVVFDKTLRECKMRGSGMLLFAAKIANACNRLKSLHIWDGANYKQPESGLQELLRMALARFQQANLRSLLKLNLNIAHSAEYDIIQGLRGSKLHTLELVFRKTDGEISDAKCLFLLREDTFPYLRKIVFGTDNEGILSDIMVNILRNLPGLRWFEIVLVPTRDNCHMVPSVELDRAVSQHIADHANLQFCSLEPRFSICSKDMFASLCNAIIASKNVGENGRMLPWLYTSIMNPGTVCWLGEPRDDQHHMGKNAYCFVSGDIFGSRLP